MKRLAGALAVLGLLLASAGAGCTGIIYDVGSDAATDGQVNGVDAQTDGPCQGVTCGGFGSCVDVGGVPACDCDPGYHAEGLACIQDQPPDPCDTVICGANAGCDQGVCLCNQGFEGDPIAGCTPISTEEELARAELVSIAMAELGYCEGVDDRPYMQYQPGYWCYDFVAWVYQQSSWALPSPLSLPQLYTGSLPGGWRPEPGDLIKFNIQHYGMVADVSPDGQVITTVEGNVNLCVMQRSTSDPSVEYYGTLDNVFAP
jgi:hypothetical protein